jgi:ribosomal protein S18 acetylase RimI-like enzyme
MATKGPHIDHVSPRNSAAAGQPPGAQQQALLIRVPPDSIFYRVRESSAESVLKELNGGAGVSTSIFTSLNQDLMFFAAARRFDSDEQKSGGTMAIVRKLLELGVLPDRLDKHKQTPLYYAAREGNTECCELLISRRCQVNHRDQWGQTPLVWAIKRNRTHTCRALYLQGAQLDVTDYSGRKAASFCTEEMGRALAAIGVPLIDLTDPGKAGAKVSRDTRRLTDLPTLRSTALTRTPSGTPARSPSQMTDLADSDEVLSQVSSNGTNSVVGSSAAETGPVAGKQKLVEPRKKVTRTSSAADIASHRRSAPAGSSLTTSTSASSASSRSLASSAPVYRIPDKVQDFKDTPAATLSFWVKPRTSPSVSSIREPTGDEILVEAASPVLGRYVVVKPRTEHAERLRELEREFVLDHYQLFSGESWVKSTTIGDWCRMVNVILGDKMAVTAIQRLLDGKMKTHVTLECLYIPPAPRTEANSTGVSHNMSSTPRIEIIGYVHFVVTQDEAYLDISHLKVSAGHGARGVGALLMAGMAKYTAQEIKQAWSRLDDVRLVVMKRNVQASKLYDALGMKATDNVMKGMRGGQIEWTRMRLPIDPDGIAGSSAIGTFLQDFSDQCSRRASTRLMAKEQKEA